MKRLFSLPEISWISNRSSARCGEPNENDSRQSRRRRIRQLAHQSGGRSRSRRSMLQRLEDRHLLAAVSGEVFLDVNEDGIRQQGESGAPDVRVYIDQNVNGQRESFEPVTQTDVNGIYSFPQIPSGDYVVRVDPDLGVVQTSPPLAFGFEDKVIQQDGRFVRATQLLSINANQEVELIGEPTTARLDGIVQIKDGTLIAVDTRSNELYRINPDSGDRTRIGQVNADIAGGLAYDRVDNLIYTLVRSSANPSSLSLGRLDINTAQVEQLGFPLAGLSTVADIDFDPEQRRIVGFDDDDNQFFAFQPTGGGFSLTRLFTPLDTSSLAIATPAMLSAAGLSSGTWVRMFDADDRDLQSSFLVNVDTGAIVAGPSVDTPIKFAALTQPRSGNVPYELSLTEFQTISGIDFGIAPDVIGFDLSPSSPSSGVSSLGQVGLTVVGGAITEDFIELKLNRRPDSNVVFDLSLSVPDSGLTGVILETNTVVFTPADWSQPQRIRITPDVDNPVAEVTTTQLTATIDRLASDIAWQTLPSQTLNVRALPPLVDLDLNAPVINELLAGVTGFFQEQVTDQFIELRGVPGQALAAGTYFVVVDETGYLDPLSAGTSPSPGTIETVIDLSGLRFGANGMLVLLPANNDYEIPFGANVVEAFNTGPGFAGLPNGIYTSVHDTGALRQDTTSNFFAGPNQSFFLIQSDTPPALNTDIDLGDGGVISETGPAAGWQIHDSIAIHGEMRSQGVLSTASIVFVDTTFDDTTGDATQFTVPAPDDSENADSFFIGLDKVVVNAFGAGYVARLGDSYGSRVTDWVGGTVESIEFVPGLISDAQHRFSGNQVSYKPLFQRELDHIGSSNFVGGVRGQIFLTPSNGEIEAGTPADQQLPAQGFSVFADSNANGIRDDLSVTVDPDAVLPVFDPFNPIPIGLEFPLTHAYAGVTITNVDANGDLDAFSPVTAERQRFGDTFISNRIFGRGFGVDFFDTDNRLRFDFLQPIKSATIDVINTSGIDVFGTARLEAYDIDGNLLASVSSFGVDSTGRESLTITFPDEQIVRLEAYASPSSPTQLISFDDLVYVQAEANGETNQDGIYEIVGLTPGVYQARLEETAVTSNLLSRSIHPFGIANYENYFFTDEYLQNTLPTANDLSVTIDENLAVGQSIASLFAQDADNGGLTYEIVNSPIQDIQLVPLFGQGIDLRVGPNTVLDYETDEVQVVTLKISDPLGASTTARVTVTLRDINEAPVPQGSEIVVTEDVEIGDIVGRLLATDPDTQANPLQTLTFEEIGGDAAEFFSIHPDTGVIRLTQIVDFETTGLLTYRVRISDSFTPDPLGPTAGQVQGVTIVDQVVRISDENDPPMIDTTPVQVPESATGELFDLIVIDPDVGQTHQFDLLRTRPPNLNVRIDESGTVILAAGAKLNHETIPQFEMDINVSDNGSPSRSTTQTLIVNVTDVNEPAVIIANGGSILAPPPVGSVNENATGAAAQVSFNSSPDSFLVLQDPEGLHADYGFDIAPGPLREIFDFNPLNGRLRVADGVMLDFESQSSYDIPFEIVDLTGQIATSQQTIRVNVNNLNEPPIITTNQFIASEVPGPLDVISVIGISDPERDPGQPIAAQFGLQIIPLAAEDFPVDPTTSVRDAANLFQLTQINGNYFLQVRPGIDFSDPSVIDFWDVDDPPLDEVKIRLRVTDNAGGQPVEKTIPIRFNDVNEPPVIDDVRLASLLGVQGQNGVYAPRVIQANSRFRVTLPDNIAVDPEGGAINPENEDNIELLVRVFDRFEDGVDDPNDGSLPNWVTFDEESLTLTALPTQAHIGQTFDFTLRVLEFIPFPLSDDFNFSFTVEANSDPANRYDVNRSGRVSDLDALKIIDHLEFQQNSDDVAQFFSSYDVSFDDVISALDALLVINFLNSGQNPIVGTGGGSGEDVSATLDDERLRREQAIDAALQVGLDDGQLF